MKLLPLKITLKVTVFIIIITITIIYKITDTGEKVEAQIQLNNPFFFCN